jgi:DNA polymerase-3 subunit delta'
VAETWLHGQMRGSIAAGTGGAFAYVKLWEGTRKAVAESDALNLDRKQVVLDFFLNLRSVRT